MSKSEERYRELFEKYPALRLITGDAAASG